MRRSCCYLITLVVLVSLPFAALLCSRLNGAVLGLDASILLNATLAALPRDLNITIEQGVVTHLPPTFRAELPEALEELLSASGSRYVPGFTTGLEELLHQQLLGLLQSAALRLATRPAARVWWRQEQRFGRAFGPAEFQLGELVRVERAFGPEDEEAELDFLWPVLGMPWPRAVPERLAKVVGVPPSRSLADFAYSVVFCDGRAADDWGPAGGATVGGPAVNCSGPSVDTRLVDEKTSDGRRLQYGVSVLGRRLPFWYRATFGAQSARIGPTPLVLTEPLDAASNLTNPQAMAGRVAVTMRGGCEFVDKALRVQQA